MAARPGLAWLWLGGWVYLIINLRSLSLSFTGLFCSLGEARAPDKGGGGRRYRYWCNGLVWFAVWVLTMIVRKKPTEMDCWVYRPCPTPSIGGRCHDTKAMSLHLHFMWYCILFRPPPPSSLLWLRFFGWFWEKELSIPLICAAKQS